MLKLKRYPRHRLRLDFAVFALALRELFKDYLKINTDKIEMFENKFAGYIGRKYAIAVPSNRIGIYLCLKALGLKEGEKVLMSAYTFKGVALAVKISGLIPEFIDIVKSGCNMDEDLIEERITSNTRAMIVSHLFGFPCDMEKIITIARKCNIKVIEDVAHSCGAEYNGRKLGCYGDFGVFSFGFGKNLMCFGGGMIVTDNEQLYRTIKNTVEGFPPQNNFKLIAKVTLSFIINSFLNEPIFSLITFPAILFLSIFDINYLDRKFNENIDQQSLKNTFLHPAAFANLQAAIGLYQLDNLDKYNSIIYRNSLKYASLLDKDAELMPVKTDIKPVRNYYMIRVKNRDNFRKRLLLRGIDTKADDMTDCSLDCSPPAWAFPNTREAIVQNLEIPNNINLKDADIEYIARQINYIMQESQFI